MATKSEALEDVRDLIEWIEVALIQARRDRTSARILVSPATAETLHTLLALVEGK